VTKSDRTCRSPPVSLSLLDEHHLFDEDAY
jgi:hypothetical protein